MPGVTVWIAVGNDVCAVCIQSFHVLGLCDVNRSRVIVYRALRRHENGIEVSVHVCAHQLVERSWLPASCPSHRSDGCRMAMPTQRALPRGRFSPARTAQPEGSGRCGCVCAAGRGAGSTARHLCRRRRGGRRKGSGGGPRPRVCQRGARPRRQQQVPPPRAGGSWGRLRARSAPPRPGARSAPRAERRRGAGILLLPLRRQAREREAAPAAAAALPEVRRPPDGADVGAAPGGQSGEPWPTCSRAPSPARPRTRRGALLAKGP